MVQLSHLYMTTGKTKALTRWIFVSKVMPLFFNMLSRFVIAFLTRRKHFLISFLQPPSMVILEPKNIKSVTVSIVFPSICHEVMGPDSMILVFWMLSFKPAFSLSSFTFIKRLFSSYVIATLSRKQTHSEGQCREWSAVYYTSGPKAESPLSQGPRPVFVKIFYTPCVRVQTHHPNPWGLQRKGKYSHNNPIIHVLCVQTVNNQ